MGKNRASPGDGSLARKTQEVGGPGEGERQVRRRATGAVVPPLKNRLPAAADSMLTMDAHAARLVAAGLSPFQAMVETYLYPGVIGDRDRERGCAMAALASGIPVQSDEVVEASREVARRLQRHVLRALPPGYPDDTAWSITGTMLGALQLARALGDNEEGRAVLTAAKRELLARYAPA